MEIGKYPDSSTCQNFESTGNLNECLLGYIFDAHIKALILREVKIEEEIDERTLNQSQVEIDENREEVQITTREGKIIKAKISKPIARRIVFLGEENQEVTLLLEPIYSAKGRGDKTYEQLLNLPLQEIEKELSLSTTESGEKIEIAPSHNKAGYYRDV